MQRFIFLGVVSVTLFALSLLTARVYATVFRSGTHGTALATWIGILFPILFIGTTLFTRLGDTIFFRIFSTSVDVLAGAAFYLLLTAILLGISLLIARGFSTTLPAYAGYIGLGVAFIATLGGIVQAQFFTVEKYTVMLEGAPASWSSKRAVLVSDTHFGMVNHEKFAQKVATKILSLHPDFVLLAGDLYDGPEVRTEGIVTAWQELTKTTPVFYAPGNHEEYGPYNIFIESAKAAGFTVLMDQKTLYDGVQIAGITYRGKQQEKVVDGILQTLSLDQNLASIMINHPPTFTETMKKYEVDLMVSGHTHNGQFWPLGYITKIIYGKFNHGLAEDQNLTVITTSGVGTAGPPLRLFNTPELVEITFQTK